MGWFKKSGSGKNEALAPSQPSATSSTAPQRSQTTGEIIMASTRPAKPATPSRSLDRTKKRVSSHDLAMAASLSSKAAPSASSSRHPLSPSPLGSSRPMDRKQQMDADMAMAYSIAQEEQQRRAEQQAVLADAEAEAVSLRARYGVPLPPPPGSRPDLAIAAALADSQFAARQADELARTSEAMYRQAVDQALEASLRSVSYDNLLRDIKLWIIDLAAATDDVLAALDGIVKQRRDVTAKLERALEAAAAAAVQEEGEGSQDGRELRRAIHKLSWLEQQLPDVEFRLRGLADRMAPVGTAVAELQDLRDHVLAASPPVGVAEQERDNVIATLFKEMEKAGFPTALGRSSAAGGASTSSAAASAPHDLRDLIADMIEDAQRLPKMPTRRRTSASGTTTRSASTADLKDLAEGSEAAAAPSAPAAPVDVSPEEVAILAPKPKLEQPSSSTSDAGEDSSVPGTPELSPSVGAGASPPPESAGRSPRRSPGPSPRRSNGVTTAPAPFQLSTSRSRSKGPGNAPPPPDTLRRMAGLVSLHYEMQKDTGVVTDAVGWAQGAPFKLETAAAVAIAAPAAAVSRSFGSPDEMVDFVRANGGFPASSPCSFGSGDRWSVMCAAAGMHEALTSAADDLIAWGVPPGASAAAEAHRLVDYLARVSALVNIIAHSHDPLRQAITKLKLPWDDKLVMRVRWAVQHAGREVMAHSLAAAEGAERTKGPWQRQAVLNPLGHAVMAAFAVHQLAGGFGTEAWVSCDQLLERTIHFARLVDPKWCRGHKMAGTS